MNTLEQKMNDAIWIAKELFDRGKATGSSANLSFLHDGHIYITGSGTCFGNLTTESFSEVSFQGQHLAGINPSKELPIHKLYYEKSEEIQAVIHVHSFYATIFSFLDHPDKTDIVPDYTPYLKMKVGTIGLVPYAKPGSNELFGYFEGEYPLEEAVRIIKRDTRHFAKRQLTWFRRERDVIWLDKSEIGREDEQLIQQMLTVLKEKEIIH